MTDNPVDREISLLAPEEAFATLGNETRMKILYALGEADGPLSFSVLRERVGRPDSGQFNYHLRKVDGHFVRKTDAGYALTQAGRRVVEAVLSGAVTDIPTIGSTGIDWPCPYCGAPIEVTYDSTTRRPVKPYCTECPGLGEMVDQYEYGQLADLRLSPAGINKRTTQEVMQAAITWGHLEDLATYSGICPRCLGAIEHSVLVCETHDSGDGMCNSCNQRHAARLNSQCTNCIFSSESLAVDLVLTHLKTLAFLTTHGVNPLTDPWGPVIGTAAEEVLSTEPFTARYTLTIENESLALTVDDSLSVIDVSNHSEE
jgi:DNA-binding HxlR family transcriptional regulator